MELDELDDLYRDAILDHCRHPRNQERVEEADIVADGVNPFCGDEIHIQIKLDPEGRVARIGFQGEGCSINQATGSMLSEAVKGRTIDGIEAISERFKAMMQDEIPQEDRPDLGELQALAGVRHFPVRIKCALLAWSTLEDGIDDFQRAHS